MSEMADAEREALAVAIRDTCSGPMSQNVNGTALLTGYVLVAEWMDESGERWLSRIDGPPGAVTGWHRDGMLHEALYGEWGEEA